VKLDLTFVDPCIIVQFINKNPTRCNSVSNFIIPYLYEAQHISGDTPPIIRSLKLQWQPQVFHTWKVVCTCTCVVVLCSWSGRPARSRTQHDYPHDTKVTPEATTAVIELLMINGKTPETCWALNKRQDNKLKNCCIWLLIYLNCTMMHGLTNLKW